MKRRVLFSFLIIAMAMAAITGGTLAWFTAEAEVESTFEAGTVEISAGNTVPGDPVEITNWNPGDKEQLAYEITNDGSKAIFLRVSFVGIWQELDGAVWVTWTDGTGDESDWPDGQGPIVNAGLITIDDAGWTEEGGYWYYNGPIAPDADVVLGEEDTDKFVVKFDVGGNADANEYQGKRFVLTATFDAIQTTNDADWNEWNIRWDATAQEWTTVAPD